MTTCRDAGVEDRGQFSQDPGEHPGDLPGDPGGEEGQAALGVRGARLHVPLRIRKLSDLHRNVSLHRVGKAILSSPSPSPKFQI